MEIEEYVEFLKDLHSILLEYLENIVESNDDFQILINLLEKQKVFENRQEIKEFFHLILIISRNRQRFPDFFSKIDKIFNYFITDIKQTLSKSELFKIFHKNKRILLFLFNKKIITIDETIKNCIIKRINSKDKNFRYFFYPEIESIIEKETSNVIKSELLQIDPEIFTDFEGKRQKGENDSYVCELIRNDSIEKFISYSNLTNLKLTMKIKPSIFETNSYLANKNPTLIEYSAFFGSIQIFQYLFLNKVKLTSSLWIYAIHGKNPDLIHLLEENKILPEDKTYEKCLKKAIKFHHNDIANYIQNNLIDEEILNFNLQKRFNENILAYTLHYAAENNNTDIINILLSDPRIKINSDLFKDCKKLKKIELTSFITTIGESLFEGCTKLKEITIPSSVTTIGKYSFYRCESLPEITIPSSVVSIGTYAFYGCISLTHITIPSSVSTIGSYTFRGCSSLKQIIIPSSVMTIGDHAFYKCSSLTEIKIPDNVPSIKDGLFGKCSSLAELSIPPLVESIGDYAFDGCESLIKISIPSSVISIGSYSFNECSTLSEISIPSSVTFIGNYAFNGCASLIQVSVPKSVKEIGTGAFEECYSLKQISFPSSLNLDCIGIESNVKVARI